jgi:hypothetical protein
MATPSSPPAPAKSNKALRALIVVVVVVVAGVIVYIEATGTIDIKVTSDHITQTVSVAVDVNNKQVSSLTLSPGQSSTFNQVELTGLGCGSYTVAATSTGGGLGSQSDSATPQLCGGGTVSVNLVV